MKAELLIICILAMTSLAYADSSRNAENIRIGALVPISGEWASNGKQIEAALTIGLEDLNKFLGEIGSDKRIVLTIEDTKAEPAQALEELKTLHEQEIKIVIVGGSSAELQAMKDYADKEGILLVGSSSTAPSLANPGDNIIRLVTDDTCQGKVMAEVLASRNIKDLIPIYRDDLWGHDLLNATRESFEARNGLVGKGVAFKPNSTSYFAEVEALGAEVKNASAVYGEDRVGVYLVSFDEGGDIMALAAKDPILSSVKWFGSDGIANLAELAQNSTLAQFAVKTGFTTPVYAGEEGSPLYANLSDTIMTITGSKPNAYAITAYDALWMAAEAELLAGSGNTPQLRAAFEQIANNYCGATGRTMLNEAGDRDFADYALLEVEKNDKRYFWNKVGLFYADFNESGLEWTADKM
jgi:branched-chain amino acid transport system substrate-binding protein